MGGLGRFDQPLIGLQMPPTAIFQTHLVLGYVAWGLCFFTYGWPWLKAMDRAQAQRAIATLHSFRFFGLVFILPGMVGPDLPASFATSTAFGDLATGILAMAALAAFRIRPLFWTLVVAFNGVGITDLVAAYAHAIEAGVPQHPGQMGAAYAIPIIYVPLLMITHCVALYWLARPQPKAARAFSADAAATSPG
jgi:hypothetical protein